MSVSSSPEPSGAGAPPSGAAVSAPVYYVAQPAAPPTLLGRLWQWFMRTFFVMSLLLNVFLWSMVVSLSGSVDTLLEKHVSGDRQARDKIAIIKVDGVIMEGFIHYVTQQIKAAAKDHDVRGVILAINSPGGSVTASDLLHKQIVDLRNGKWPGQEKPKPVVVSMESIAASGGYYIAAPAQKIVAQPTTITGSIGVYAQLFNVAGLAEKYGVEFKLIKKGELKGSGSPFKKMTPEEEREFAELMESSYQRFMRIVKEGRDGQPEGARLKYELRDEIQVETLTEPKTTYVRRLADGGAFTADEALNYGLIDQIGYQEDAIRLLQSLLGEPSSQFKVVSYVKPFSWGDALFGMKDETPPMGMTLDQIPGATRRMWYLTSGYELAGLNLAAFQSKK